MVFQRSTLLAVAAPLILMGAQLQDLPALADHGVIPFGGFKPGLPPVVIVHGKDGDPEHFRNLANGLKPGEEHNVFFYIYEEDMIVGSASASAMAGPRLQAFVDSLETFDQAKNGLVEAVREIVRQTGDRSVSLVGHSAGAVMSWAAVSQGRGEKLIEDTALHVDVFVVDPPARGLSGMTGAAGWDVSSLFTRQFGGFWDVMGSPWDSVFTGSTGPNASVYLFVSREDEVVTFEGQTPASRGRRPTETIEISGTHVGSIRDPSNVTTIVAKIKDVEGRRTTPPNTDQRASAGGSDPGQNLSGTETPAGTRARPGVDSDTPADPVGDGSTGATDSPVSPNRPTTGAGTQRAVEQLGTGTGDIGRLLSEERTNFCCETGAQPMMLHFSVPLLVSGGSVQPTALAAQSTSSPGVLALVTSVGASQGEAFSVQILNTADAPAEISVEGIVVEPLRQEASDRIAAEIRRRYGGALQQSTTAYVEGYCLAHDLEVPSNGMVFRVAGPDVQERFRTAAAVLEAAERLQESGQIHPDSDPPAYFSSIKQFAVWSMMEGWDDQEFAQAWVDLVRRNAATLDQPWTSAIESALRAAAVGRWRDIQAILSEATTP